MKQGLFVYLKEFFEEEDSGDKTNPDPDDIATFFEEEESDSTEKTNINETQMLQTRIASIDEINYKYLPDWNGKRTAWITAGSRVAACRLKNAYLDNFFIAAGRC